MGTLQTDEVGLEEMVNEGYIRLQEKATGIQHLFTNVNNITWPATILIWPKYQIKTKNDAEGTRTTTTSTLPAEPMFANNITLPYLIKPKNDDEGFNPNRFCNED